MKKKKTTFIIFVIAIIVFCMPVYYSTAIPQCYAYDEIYKTNAKKDNILTKGIFVKITLSVTGGNNQVQATVKHDFSIFPTTVNVYVFLYYSTSFTVDYQDMELVCFDHSSNLALNDTLTVTASTGGEQRYWIARMYYKIDDREWENRITGPVLCSATGELINV